MSIEPKVLLKNCVNSQMITKRINPNLYKMESRQKLEYFTNEFLQSQSQSKASLFESEPSLNEQFSFDERKVTKDFVPKMKELRSEKARSVLNSNLNRNIQTLTNPSTNKHKISSFLKNRHSNS